MERGLRLGRIGRFGAIVMCVWLVASTAWATKSRRFDLAAGAAEQALNEFAVQTGLQVLYPTELTAGIESNAVRGHYTVREALDRMLSDTGLVATYNEQTGVIEIAHARPPREEIVRLPPYTVEGETKVWRYAKMGQIEVLSACMDDVTRRVIQQLFRLQEALDQIIPPDLRFTDGSPVAYVLHADTEQTAVPEELVNRLKQHRNTGSGQTRLVWNIGIMNSYGFWDMDGRAIYFILNEGGFLFGRLRIRGDYLREMLARRSPALPAWYIEGMMELYSTVNLEPYGATTFAMEIKNRHKIPGGMAKVAPYVWISPEETVAVRKGRRPDLLPLSVMLEQPPALGTEDYRRWKAQAGLFVRWALDDAKKGREALWNLVRLADRKQLTEADFRTCFGMGFADADDDLRRYLPKALRREFELKPKQFAEPPVYNLRMATGLDVSLVKGELDRLKVDYVKRFAPKLTQRYIDQARSTLRRALDQGDGSARLAGLMGLCECDAGDDLAARPWLEQAVAGGDVRPRVYYELARIRFNQTRSRHGDQPLSADELEGLLDLLQTAGRQAPPLIAAYDLMAEILRSGPAAPEHIRMLAAGLEHFPRHIDLIKAVAMLWREQQAGHEAQIVIDHGLRMVDDPAGRAALLNLRAE